MTEWKTAGPSKNADRAFEEARSRGARYAHGVLAGIELAAYRYAVVVSERHEQVAADVRDGAVIYRHIDIAVDPRTPSRSRSNSDHPVATEVFNLRIRIAEVTEDGVRVLAEGGDGIEALRAVG